MPKNWEGSTEDTGSYSHAEWRRDQREEKRWLNLSDEEKQEEEEIKKRRELEEYHKTNQHSNGHNPWGV